MNIPSSMTFFERFEADILAGRKTITLRNEDEKDFVPGSVVQVATFETGRVFCYLTILSVEPIAFSALNQHHAEQENMTLAELRQVIQEIYPGIEALYLIQFSLAEKDTATH